MSITPEDAYAHWQSNPTPENLSGVVDTLSPTLHYALGQLSGGSNPLLKHKGKLILANAVQSFNPASGAKLSSWSQSQLMGLRRANRETGNPIKIPERAQLDAWHLERTRRDYLDQHGFEPDITQLADASKLGVKRITEVHRLTRPTVSEGALGDAELHSTDFLGEAFEYLRDESDAVDRHIIDHSTGYGGAEKLQKNEIAAKLGISPSQVTRRADRIFRGVRELETQLQGSNA